MLWATMLPIRPTMVVAGTCLVLGLTAGCFESEKAPVAPEVPDQPTAVGIVVSDFPFAPDHCVLYAGEEQVEVHLDTPAPDTLWTSLVLPQGRLQYVALMDSVPDVYGVALSIGDQTPVVVSASSTIEVPINAAPNIWSKDPTITGQNLRGIRAHPQYSPLVARVRTLLQSSRMDAAFDDSRVYVLGAEIVSGISRSQTKMGAARQQTTRGMVSLQVPENAEAARVFIRGPFGYPGIDISRVPITVINAFPRYLIPCRVDYPRGGGSPLPPLRWPRGRIPKGDPFEPYRLDAIISFTFNNLEKVELTFVGAGGRGAWSAPCIGTMDVMRAELSALIPSVAGLAAVGSGFFESFEAWIFGVGASLASDAIQLDASIEANDDREYFRVFRDVIFEFATGSATGLGLKPLKLITGSYAVFTNTVYLATLSECPRVVTFRMYAEETLPPGDQQPGLRNFHLAWESGSESYVPCLSKVAQRYDPETLHFIFDGSDEIGSDPRVLVRIFDAPEIPLYTPIPCSMIITFDEGQAASPMSCLRDGVNREVATNVVFFDYEEPQGLFPTIASGYFTGGLGFYHMPPGEESWCEQVSIISAPFDSVRVYAISTPPSGQ